MRDPTQDGASFGHDLLLRCEDCKSEQLPRESWWCRNCAATVCKSCNLLKGHTEHRSAPWQENDVLRTCALLLEARCSRRSKQAADEEIAIKEFIAEVEALLVLKVQHRLEEDNELDRRRICTVCSALGLEGKTYYMPSPGCLPSIRGPSDDHVDRVVFEASKIMKSPQLREAMNAKIPEKLPMTSKKSFAILPDVSAEEFTRILEEKLASHSAYCAAVRKRETSSDNGFHSEGDLPGISVADLSGIVDKNNQMPRQAHNVSTSTPLDEDCGPQFRFPLEPKINISNDPLPNSADRSPLLDRRSNGIMANGNLRSPLSAKSQMSLLSENLGSRLDSGSSSRLGLPMDSFSLNDSYEADGRVSRLSGRRSIQMLVHDDATEKKPSHLLNGGIPKSEGRTPTPTGGMDSTDGGRRSKGAVSDGRASTSTTSTKHIMSFHFGSEFFTRPIDVCALPGDRLAVSDSCGGVYVTTRNGEIVKQILCEGSSASSLYFCSDKNRLYVSVMKKRGRQVNVYDRSADFKLIETIECPKDPKIEQSRTRWLAVGKSGEIFAVSGDNKRSALWKYNYYESDWMTVTDEKNTRYQYLHVTENRPEDSSVVLLTCEGISGALLLFVVGRNGKLWAQYNLCETYHLRDYIRSPASAIVDGQGNLLVLDYTNGKLWILMEGGEGVRRLKVLAEVGSQQGLGLAVSGDWCYVACFNKKRVQAIKYLELEEDDDEVFATESFSRRESSLGKE